MDDYNKLLKVSLDYKKKRDEKYKEISRDRLFNVAKKKVQTTMIGALSTLEEHFGFLWGFEQSEELTPEQQHMKTIFEEARSKILDRGNTQIRNLESEFASYEITWKKNSISLPMIKRGEEHE